MSILTTAHTLSVTSEAIPIVLGIAALEAVRLAGDEDINGLFEYKLWLKTPDDLNLGASQAADFDLEQFIGHDICCRIALDGAGSFVPGLTGAPTDHVGAGVREINAIITDAEVWGEEGRHVQYILTLRPALHLATENCDVRVFQNMTVVHILEAVFAPYPFVLEKRLIETYPLRDTQTQCDESDYVFALRLMQEWGISFFQAHSEGHHRLVLVDNMGAYPTTSPLPWVPSTYT